jgi:hypothetical protein
MVTGELPKPILSEVHEKVFSPSILKILARALARDTAAWTACDQAKIFESAREPLYAPKRRVTGDCGGRIVRSKTKLRVILRHSVRAEYDNQRNTAIRHPFEAVLLKRFVWSRRATRTDFRQVIAHNFPATCSDFFPSSEFDEDRKKDKEKKTQ